MFYYSPTINNHFEFLYLVCFVRAFLYEPSEFDKLMSYIFRDVIMFKSIVFNEKEMSINYVLNL